MDRRVDDTLPGLRGPELRDRDFLARGEAFLRRGARRPARRSGEFAFGVDDRHRPRGDPPPGTSRSAGRIACASLVYSAVSSSAAPRTRRVLSEAEGRRCREVRASNSWISAAIAREISEQVVRLRPAHPSSVERRLRAGRLVVVERRRSRTPSASVGTMKMPTSPSIQIVGRAPGCDRRELASGHADLAAVEMQPALLAVPASRGWSARSGSARSFDQARGEHQRRPPRPSGSNAFFCARRCRTRRSAARRAPASR